MTDALHQVLYSPYPSTFPEYLSASRFANFLEYYAVSQDLDIWTSSEVTQPPVYDSSSQKWTVHIDHAGTKTTISPKHLVLAVGLAGEKNMPELEGLGDFNGKAYHSSEHRSGEIGRGKRVVIVGTVRSFEAL